jgi:hypothetical protein
VSRHLARRLLLGSGPLKRRSDRLHALSRVGVLAAALAALPVAVVVGVATSSLLQGTAAAQAAARSERTATLLVGAPDGTSQEDGVVPAKAQWRDLDGRLRTGEVLAPMGAAAGSRVTIWLDPGGRFTTPPLRGEDITAESIAAGALAAVTLPTLVALVHLLVVNLLDRSRLRQWAHEWASVEPSWAGRAP